MSVVIEGKLETQEAIDNLMHLKLALQRKIIRESLIVASQPMLEQAELNLDKGNHGHETGLLQKSLAKKDRTYAQKNLVVVIIGPKNKMKQYVELSPDRIFRQVGGVKGSKKHGIKGVFGKTTHFFPAKPEYLRREEDPAKIAHLVERGSRYRKPYPFLLPAFRTKKNEVESIFASRVQVGIEKEALGMYVRRR